MNRYVFIGSFCPPTYGHLHILEKACSMLPRVEILCAENPSKDNIFNLEERKEMWDSYNLPQNCIIKSLSDYKDTDLSNVVVVRGLRNKDDVDLEQQVIVQNKKLGIDKFMFILSDEPKSSISSSRSRWDAEHLNLINLSHAVSPTIATRMIEYYLGIKNLILVVGRPGGGKSTFLKWMTEADKRNIHINTDEFSENFIQLLIEAFGERDWIEMARKDEKKLIQVIGEPWMDMLKQKLKATPKDSNVFVEVAYGMQEHKGIYRMIGGKVLSISCGGKNHERNDERGTPQIKDFIGTIPDEVQTHDICMRNKIKLTEISTEYGIQNTKDIALAYSASLR